MMSTESVIQVAPFTVRRKVKWGECDPAGVVYTVVFGEYVMSTAELFYAHLRQEHPKMLEERSTYGTPTKALSFEFHRALWPDEYFDLEVQVGRLTDKTYELLIKAYTLDREKAFQASLIPVCIAKNERRSIQLPQGLRDALIHYQTQATR